MGMVAKVPFMVVSGGICGFVGGLAMGVMTSHPTGLVLCSFFGLVTGAVCGGVLFREQNRESQHTRKLDDIIGITQGSMGAPPGSIPPGPLDEPDFDDAWAREWLTPPPPQVG